MSGSKSNRFNLEEGPEGREEGEGKRQQQRPEEEEERTEIELLLETKRSLECEKPEFMLYLWTILRRDGRRKTESGGSKSPVWGGGGGRRTTRTQEGRGRKRRKKKKEKRPPPGYPESSPEDLAVFRTDEEGPEPEPCTWEIE